MHSEENTAEHRQKILLSYLVSCLLQTDFKDPWSFWDLPYLKLVVFPATQF